MFWLLLFPCSSFSFSLFPLFPSIKVNGCLMDPLPPPNVLRKSSTSSPSNMMETSIDEGIETEEPDTEEDSPHLLSAYQTARFGQRRHTLSEMTNQPGPSNQGLIPQYAVNAGHNLGFAVTSLKLMNYLIHQVNFSLWATIRPRVAWTRIWATTWAPCTATLACWRIRPPSVNWSLQTAVLSPLHLS